MLKDGDLGFILTANPSRLGELARLHPSAPFYAGLLVEARQGEEAAAALFGAALESPSPWARKAAAEKLLPGMLERGDRALAETLLKLPRTNRGAPPEEPFPGAEAAARYVLGREPRLLSLPDTDPLSRALDLLSSHRRTGAGESPAARELAALFLSLPPASFAQSPGDRIFPWIFAELGEPSALSPGEKAAIAGRLAVSRGAYTQGLASFREALETDLFFRHPELLGDLGRALQFAAPGEEGVALFSAWDRFLRTGLAADAAAAEAAPEEAVPGETGTAGAALPIPALPAAPDIPALRYRLLYFAGRMERQRERYRSAAEYFTRALDLAPDAAQEDACIWYILNVNFLAGPSSVLPLLRVYRSRWHDDFYFADILDRLCRVMTAEGQWAALGEVFTLIRAGEDGAAAAQYAWILGRALQEGYLSPREGAAFLPPEERDRGAEGYFSIVLEKEGASLYYRAMAAAALGRSLSIPEEEKDPSRGAGDFPHPGEMDFLLGFFRFGAGAFAFPYIRDAAEGLSLPEQRALAEALSEGERWEECIRLVSAYTSRGDYRRDRRDLELAHPRPYRDLIEDTAREAGISPALFYGLIRTESAFTADISSRAGAVGLAQLMNDTALDMAGRLSRRGGPDYIREGAVELRDPAVNLHLGGLYLAYLMERMETPMLALLAYNGGMGRVRRWRAAEPRLPPDLFTETIEFNETREYGRKVMAAAAVYGYLYYDVTMEAVIADIYRAGP